jgi:ankyrin repeat protein
MARELREANRELAREFTESDLRQAAHAARNNEVEAVRLLLECGVPVDGTSQHRATPLHWAAFHGNREMTETILGFGPPLEAVDADHNGTPLGWAIYGSQHGWYSDSGDYAGTVEALIAAGAKLPAEIGGSETVKEVLRRHGISSERA